MFMLFRRGSYSGATAGSFSGAGAGAGAGVTVRTLAAGPQGEQISWRHESHVSWQQPTMPSRPTRAAKVKQRMFVIPSNFI